MSGARPTRPTQVLVTGAGGNVGREVVRALAQGEVGCTAADRRADASALPAGVSARKLDFRDRATWDHAIEGHNALFLVRPPAISDVEETLIPFVDAARARGVDHVVFLSVAGAEKNRLVPHRKVEDALRSRGDAHTILRPGFFAQNLHSAYHDDIVERDRIYVPAGRAPVNWIDARDIAAVAARVFADPAPHRGQAYTLTGPGAVPWSVVTGALSEALGRPIRYRPASIPGYALHLVRAGRPLGAVAVQTILHALLRVGGGATFDPALESLLGRPARSIVEVIRRDADVWRRDAERGPREG